MAASLPSTYDTELNYPWHFNLNDPRNQVVKCTDNQICLCTVLLFSNKYHFYSPLSNNLLS